MGLSDVMQRDWYYQYTHQKINEINSQMKWWKTYDHNVVPTGPACPKWTDCTVISKPINATTTDHVDLKPEFTNHTSGVINNPTPIKNFYDLEKWLEGKNQKKN